MKTKGKCTTYNRAIQEVEGKKQVQNLLIFY